ncbi:MAG: PAS domain S-box protein [Candidatus Hydrogenedentes bacterium]|nr:PAS domain S-box protein [Candidatus Hydrogenedentota bacterium]
MEHANNGQGGGALSAELESQLLLAIGQSDVAVGLTDIDGTFTWVNSALVHLTGRAADDLLGRSIEVLRAQAHDRALCDEIRAALKTDGRWSGRIAIGHRDGVDRWARGVTTAVRDDTGGLVGYCLCIRDTTEEARLEAQLGHLQKMEAIGELAAGIAHEINTPIQYVGDNIQFLKDGVSGLLRLVDALEAACARAGLTDPDRDALQRLREEIDLDFLRDELPLAIDQSIEGRDRVAAIVRAMKEFAHPGDEDWSSIDVNRAIENTLAVSRGEWKHAATVELELASDLPPVPCYPGSFNQVLLNLVVNASHAIQEAAAGGGKREPGVIRIFTREAGDRVEIGIGDNGCGIPPENLQRIFEPFFTTKDIGKGTGQGLALVHAVVVDRLGGSIGVDSAPGKGTLFTLSLPLQGKQAAGAG